MLVCAYFHLTEKSTISAEIVYLKHVTITLICLACVWCASFSLGRQLHWMQSNPGAEEGSVWWSALSTTSQLIGYDMEIALYKIAVQPNSSLQYRKSVLRLNISLLSSFSEPHLPFHITTHIHPSAIYTVCMSERSRSTYYFFFFLVLSNTTLGTQRPVKS